ncbi:hypothetical protein ERJ75_000107000 [Trypanosoma vivax]|uniref:Uncharacterized protein n=1 Tax=Trypanosoma vivax (strain Y486) TaxID=1055687 RepID=G0U811_TRYVY|nr:hypothetical protein TRVL_09437 [Trypanosoma vivax]KAH8607334.1 hypothetical protein ERJ75_001446500 [Trypanosoma vivax]KAH8620021.1 hypothetical protein ERJ75_000107000 [Trypanosoma vivax]CCC52019.1 conserved hypothetical protein [Trypanosoma vivax Y486]
MRQWALAELETTPSTQSSVKRRIRGRGLSLQELSANNLRLLSRPLSDDETPPVRLSRHIPQREGMDMAVAAYNLTTNATSVTTPLTTNVTAGYTSIGGGRSMTISTAASSSIFSESFVSDDSLYVTSVYNEVLAEQLSSEHPQRHRKIGGEVLRFETTDSVQPRRISPVSRPFTSSSIGDDLCENDRERLSDFTTGVNSAQASGRPLFSNSPTGRFLLKRIKSCKSVPQRVLCTNPERALDAPEFPAKAKQLLHWGSNNKLVIGLKNGLHAWDAETAKASQIVQLQGQFDICAVHWLHTCTCVAIALDEGATAIYDCNHREFLRSLRVRLTPDAEISYIAVNGPMLAVGTSAAAGGLHIFDVRVKNALVSVYEGHTGGVTSLNYCTMEPFYLAAGSASGGVRVWDARRSSSPRYSFDNVHRGCTSALLWDPDRRTKMYTGGQDGMMCYIDTHAPVTNVSSTVRTDEEIHGGSTHCVTRAINTAYPINNIVSPPGSGELATTHCGRGHIQLRQSSNFHLIGTLGSPNCTAGITCATVAPDGERICAAQEELLKFWRVFWPSSTVRRAKSATPPPATLLDHELR